MGATTFSVRSVGDNAKDAFQKAVENARYESGNGGYTGTIAEKRSFVLINMPTKPTSFRDVYTYADQLIDNGDKRIDDKWGPAGCIYIGEAPLGKSEYYFFGWASD